MTELDKLKQAAGMIRSVSEGRLELRPCVVGHVYVHPEDDAYIGMELVEKYDAADQRLEVSFQAFVRRMATYMDADGLRALQGEVHNAYALLTALEMQDFRPTQEDMMALREHLAQQQEREQTAPQQTGPVMG